MGAVESAAGQGKAERLDTGSPRGLARWWQSDLHNLAEHLLTLEREARSDDFQVQADALRQAAALLTGAATRLALEA